MKADAVTLPAARRGGRAARRGRWSTDSQQLVQGRWSQSRREHRAPPTVRRARAGPHLLGPRGARRLKLVDEIGGEEEALAWLEATKRHR
ncbi:MAG: hypothetical protein V9G29_05660 [Burkholderiaceae bacterium]